MVSVLHHTSFLTTRPASKLRGLHTYTYACMKYGDPKGHAMRWRTCDNIDATVDNNNVTIGNNDVTTDNTHMTNFMWR